MTTWNPSDKNASLTLSNGDLTGTGSGGFFAFESARATTSKASGKYYFETYIGASSGFAPSHDLGVASLSVALNVNLASTANSAIIRAQNNGHIIFINGTSPDGVTYTGPVGAGVILRVALDADADEIWLGRNTTWYPGEPSSVSGYSFSLSDFYPIGGFQSVTATARFDLDSQTYGPPDGFSAWDEVVGETTPQPYVKDAGVWKPVTDTFVKDAGVWKPVIASFAKDAGVWKEPV